MLHPDTEIKFINLEIGYGVFATSFIPKGTIIWALDKLDLRISINEVKALPALIREKVEHFGYINRFGQYILNWDLTRFINHSCTPTTRSLNDALDVAVCDINKGEQLTCDYGILNYKDMICICGSKNCRKVIKSNDCEFFFSIWDKEVADAWAVANLVNQPLLPIAKLNENNDVILETLQSGVCATIPSSRTYKFNGSIF